MLSATSHSRFRWLIFLAVVVVYLPSLRNGYIWDDQQYVTNNPTLRTASGLLDIWIDPTATPQYYPMVYSSFWIEFHLWGLNPIGYHLDNILLHALSCVLLLGVLRRMNVRGAGWAALLFALHPVMVESVAWITERKNVLSGVFILAAMRWAIRCWNLQDQDRPNLAGVPLARVRCKPYTLCVGFFIAALLAKTVACTFPLTVLLLIYWRRGRVRLGELLSLVPMLLIGAAFGLMTAYLERHHVGASGPQWQLSIAQRLVLSGRVVWFYLGKLLWPSPLIFIYPHWVLRPDHLLQWAGLLGAMLTMLGLWIARPGAGRGPLVLGAIFVVTLAPALGFANVYPFRFSFVADHFQYMAAIAVFVAVGWVWSRLTPQLATSVGTMVLVILAVLTWHRQSAYASLHTLWSDTLAKNPSAWIASNNLAMLEFDRGDHAAAVRAFNRAATTFPDVPAVQANFGAALLSVHQNTQAEIALNKAVQLNPADAFAWHDLGLAAMALGNGDKALRAFETALRLEPHNVIFQADLAWLLATSPMTSVKNPQRALSLAKLAEAGSNGYSIRAIEARAAAEADMGQTNRAAADAARAAALANASGDHARADIDHQRAAAYRGGEKQDARNPQ